MHTVGAEALEAKIGAWCAGYSPRRDGDVACLRLVGSFGLSASNRANAGRLQSIQFSTAASSRYTLAQDVSLYSSALLYLLDRVNSKRSSDI